MKIEWALSGQPVETPAVVFGFDAVDEIVNGKVTLSWLKGGATPKKAHNLVISETGVDSGVLGRVIIEAASKELPCHAKGEEGQGTARLVYPILNDPALPFRAGLTVHAARGTWSSLPHKFEAEEILTPRPMPFYERFAYVTDPPGGWGVQMRIGHLFNEYGESVWDGYQFQNEALIIRDRDILGIPLGSHPVSGGPGVRLCYFWVYWGSLEGREKF